MYVIIYSYNPIYNKVLFRTNNVITGGKAAEAAQGKHTCIKTHQRTQQKAQYTQTTFSTEHVSTAHL